MTFPSNAFSSEGKASQLFEQAEKAIQETENSYKALNKQWKDAKKVYNDIAKDLTFSKDELKKVENDLLKLEEAALQVYSADEAVLSSIKKEIYSLRVSTAKKYKAAEDADQLSPSELSKLFQSAQTEASVLKVTENIQKEVEDLQSSIKNMLKLSSNSVQGIQQSLSQLKSAENEQVEAYQTLNDGVALTAKKNGGSKIFAKGISLLIKAQKDDEKVLRGLAKDIKNVQVESEELEQLSSKVSAVASEVNVFQSSSKLSIPRSIDSTIRNFVEKTESSSKLSKQSLDNILTKSNQVSSRQFQKGSKFSKRSELDRLLTQVSSTLAVAETFRSKAEALLSEAKKQGEREASVYLKYYQYANEKNDVKSSGSNTKGVPAVKTVPTTNNVPVTKSVPTTNNVPVSKNVPVAKVVPSTTATVADSKSAVKTTDVNGNKISYKTSTGEVKEITVPAATGVGISK